LKGQFHQVLQEATQAGVTLLAATGDNGTAGQNVEMTSMMDIRSTDYPGSDPFVTAVGGTALEYGWKWNPQGTMDDYMDCKSRQALDRKVNPNVTPADCPMDILSSLEISGSRIETVWKEDWALAAGGGGVSQIFASPDYQQALPANVKAIGAGFRTIPDISMNAAINGGVVTYASYMAPGDKAPAGWSPIGGTSAATPEMAGLVALAGQRASDLLGKQVGIGSLNKILYSLSTIDFNDVVAQSFGAQNQIIVDNNGLYFSQLALSLFGATSETPVPVPGYAATPGYDLATGLGTPVADKMVEDIAQARASQEKAPILP
jgi:subtilase family serine protease